MPDNKTQNLPTIESIMNYIVTVNESQFQCRKKKHNNSQVRLHMAGFWLRPNLISGKMFLLNYEILDCQKVVKRFLKTLIVKLHEPVESDYSTLVVGPLKTSGN